MNIIIAGDGEVGSHLAKMLSSERHNIVVVDPNEEVLQMVESQSDLLTIAGSSISIKTLQDANVANADLLISVVHEEMVNIITCILGKKLGAKQTIARISNIEYLSPNNRELFKSIGIDKLICPESIAAKEIINLLEQTIATEVFEFSQGALSLMLFRLDKNAPVIGKSLDQIAHEYVHLDFRAVAIHRKGKTIIPHGNDVFMEKDLAYVISKKSGIEALYTLGGKTKLDIKNVMIIGGGRIGKITAKNLEKTMHVKLVEMNKERCLDLADKLKDTLIINGDATDIDLLIEEDIENVDAFIAVTNNTETNILTCLNASKYGVKKTIALVENIAYINLSQDIGIDTIINKKLIAASYIVRFTYDANIISSKILSGVDAEVLEFLVQPNSPATQKPINRLKFPEGSIIGGIIRGNESFIAVGNFQIQAKDKVVIFSLPSAVSKVSKLFI